MSDLYRVDRPGYPPVWFATETEALSFEAGWIEAVNAKRPPAARQIVPPVFVVAIDERFLDPEVGVIRPRETQPEMPAPRRNALDALQAWFNRGRTA